MGISITTPVSIDIVHHPLCQSAERLAARLYEWFRLAHLGGNVGEAGLPVFFRRQLSGSGLHPQIAFQEARLNVVIALVDHLLVGDTQWRTALVDLAESIDQMRGNGSSASRALLLPAAMHDSFYRTGPLYDRFNPVRLLDMTEDRMLATVRRAATEATARLLRAGDAKDPPPLNVFLSHAKKDG